MRASFRDRNIKRMRGTEKQASHSAKESTATISAVDQSGTNKITFSHWNQMNPGIMRGSLSGAYRSPVPLAYQKGE